MKSKLVSGLGLLWLSLSALAEDKGPEPFRCQVGGATVLSELPCAVSKQLPARDIVVLFQCRQGKVDVYQQQPCTAGQQHIRLFQEVRDAGDVAIAQQQAQSTTKAVAILQSDNAPATSLGGVSKTGYTDQAFSGAQPSSGIGTGERVKSYSGDGNSIEAEREARGTPEKK